MYAVVEVAGHQYKVKAGDLLDVDKLKSEAGTNLEIDQVLFVGGDQSLVGAPTVKGAKVTARVIKHDKARKLLVFKRKPGLYQKRRGHRTHYTALLITEVADGTGKSDKLDKNSKVAQKYLK